MARLRAVALTHRGVVRDHNEDTIALGGFLSSAHEGEPVRLAIESERPIPCLVADGLGGHAEGDRASRLVAAFLSDAWVRAGDPDSISDAVQRAHGAVYDEMNRSSAWQGMGTTLAGLIFSGNQVTCVNVGDSRAYRISDDLLVQISVDDSPPLSSDAPANAVTNVVTQTIGGSDPPRTLEPHVFSDTTGPGDRFLLCSDGLTDYVPLDTLENHLRSSGGPGEAVQAMLDAALDVGGPDNISIILLTVV